MLLTSSRSQHLTTHYNPPTTLDGLRITGSSDGLDGGGPESNGGEAERAVSVRARRGDGNIGR